MEADHDCSTPSVAVEAVKKPVTKPVTSRATALEQDLDIDLPKPSKSGPGGLKVAIETTYDHNYS